MYAKAFFSKDTKYMYVKVFSVEMRSAYAKVLYKFLK